jgi:hypothetical protein
MEPRASITATMAQGKEKKEPEGKRALSSRMKHEPKSSSRRIEAVHPPRLEPTKQPHHGMKQGRKVASKTSKKGKRKAEQSDTDAHQVMHAKGFPQPLLKAYLGVGC